MVGSLDTLPLSQLDGDVSFRLRDEGDVTGLAQSLAREGQLVPIEVRLRGPGHWQIVAGFRRVAALRLLQRENVLARLHDQLSDEDALALAVADGVTERPIQREELEAIRVRLQGDGRYGTAVQEAIERALGEAPPPPEPEEIDLDVFSREVRDRLAETAIDVGSLFENWADVDAPIREDLRAQLRYFRDLLPFLNERDIAARPASRTEVPARAPETQFGAEADDEGSQREDLDSGGSADDEGRREGPEGDGSGVESARSGSVGGDPGEGEGSSSNGAPSNEGSVHAHAQAERSGDSNEAAAVEAPPDPKY